MKTAQELLIELREAQGGDVCECPDCDYAVRAIIEREQAEHAAALAAAVEEMRARCEGIARVRAQTAGATVKRLQPNDPPFGKYAARWDEADVIAEAIAALAPRGAATPDLVTKAIESMELELRYPDGRSDPLSPQMQFTIRLWIKWLEASRVAAVPIRQWKDTMGAWNDYEPGEEEHKVNRVVSRGAVVPGPFAADELRGFNGGLTRAARMLRDLAGNADTDTEQRARKALLHAASRLDGLKVDHEASRGAATGAGLACAYEGCGHPPGAHASCGACQADDCECDGGFIEPSAAAPKQEANDLFGEVHEILARLKSGAPPDVSPEFRAACKRIAERAPASEEEAAAAGAAFIMGTLGDAPAEAETRETPHAFAPTYRPSAPCFYCPHPEPHPIHTQPGPTPREEHGFVRYPKDRPPRYNGSSEPCDMLVGPCSCGAWHAADGLTVDDLRRAGAEDFDLAQFAVPKDPTP